MNKKGDYIEVGAGKDSKVIGQNNSVSEYLTTVLSMLRYLKIFCLVSFGVVFGLAWWAGIPWQAAMICGCVAMVLTAVIILCAMMKIFETLKSIQEPMPGRAKNGRFQSTVNHNRNGKKRGEVRKTVDTSYEYVDTWGGVGGSD